MDIDNDINQVLPAGKLTREPDCPTHLCTSILQNSTPNSSKTVPFFPRVLLSVQQPLSSLINQTIIQPTSLTTASSGTNTPQPHVTSLHMSAASVSSPINSANQFFPLILAATSTLPPPTSSAPTSLQLHLGNYSGSSTVASASSQSIFLQPNISATTSCLSVPNVLCSPSRLNTSNVTTASTPLVASLINRTCSTSPSIASVVISPQTPNHIQPTLALRFASRTSTNSAAMVTTATVNSSACPLVFETTTSITLPLQSQRPHCVTALSFPTPVSCVSGSLLMSSTLCSTPRVFIHKSQSLSNPPSLIENLASQISTISPCKMSTSDSSFSSLSNPAIILHDQISSQSQHASKAKLVNFATPISATVRLIAPPSTACTTTKSTCTVSTSGTSVLAFPTLISQTGALPSRPSIANTGSVWSGLTVNPNVSLMSASSGNVVTIQPSQSLIVQSQSDLPVQSTVTTSSLNPSLMMSLRSLSGSSSNTSTSLPLNTANHTVLAFNLTNSNVHSATTTCTNVTGMFTNPVRQINACNPTSPLIVRASGPSAIGYIPNTNAPTGPTSLLKPFSLGGNTGLCAASSCTSVVPHILPVNIAPAKLTPLQPSVSSSTSSTSHARSHFSQGNSVCVSSHRLPTSSIFSQPSRKRARKQQLASSFSSVMVTPVSVVSSATSTAVSINSLVNPSTLSSGVSGCRSVLSSTPTLVAVSKPTIQPYQFTQPLYGCQVSHSPQVSGNYAKSGVVSVDSLYRNTSTTISVSCTTNVSPSNSGLMGIRLVSVRSAPTTSVPSGSSILINTTCLQSSAGSFGTRVNAADNSVVVTAPSNLLSPGGHLRISSSHCSQTSDIHQTQTAAVYVLTTSVYPILSTTTVTSSTSSVSELTSSAPSIVNPVVVSGAKNGVLQVRFRSPQPNISPSIIPENQESKSQPITSYNILPTSLYSMPDISKSISEDSKYSNQSSKPFRCASESNPLLHHLVSSLKQPQNETTTDVNQLNNTDLKMSDSLSAHSELSVSSSWLHNNIEDSKQLIPANLNSNEKRNCFYPTTSRDDSDFNECDDDIFNEKSLSVSTHNVPCKKIKSELEVNDCQKANDPTTRNDYHSNNKLSKAGVLWTVDPVDGREWILNGRPPRPLINPKCGLSNNRLGGIYRSKNSHFLSLSEIYIKSQHKSVNADDSSRQDVHTTRRRRRSLVTGTNLSQVESAIQNKGVRDINSLNDLNANYDESDGAKRIVQDILAIRAEQEESGFVRFPLTITSILDITGWRVLHCADNLDFLAYTELQTLETIKCMETDIADQLRCISTQSFKSSLPNVSQNVTDETVRPTECEADESEITNQFNVAIELIKGISQRKNCLLDSIQRLSSVTKNLVHHFSPRIHQLVEELEDSSNNSSISLSPSSSKTNLNSNTLSTPLTLRRSSRKYATHNPIVRQVRRRNAVTVINRSKPLASLIKNSPNTCPGTSSQANICNGGPSNYSVIR